MTDLRRFFGHLIKWPMRLLVSSKVIPEQIQESLDIDLAKPIFYVLRHDSLADILTLQKVCKEQSLPDPLDPVVIQGKSFRRYICLDKLPSILSNQTAATQAEPQVLDLLALHKSQADLDCQLVPAFFAWGRGPGKASNEGEKIFNDKRKPNTFRKTLIVLFSGRHNLVQFSQPVSIRQVADNYGFDKSVAHKLLRVARFHFQRQHLAIAGPRLWQREQLINSLLASDALKKAIEDEAKTKNINISEARETARQYLDEMAADYREGMVRIGEKFLTWIWNKLYHGINVSNAETVRKLAHDGNEIVYVPCHRSHMDYLLLTYVIYQQGLVPPHIAAGINLNFWPVGIMFRRGGAFFMRRSFRGNKLYSAAFREYLAQLLSKGYSIKYYPESGRSRTGRLLKPKTGMVAMTVQSALRGLDRNITFVPVYIGYEHVMEVSTYMQELSGQAKKKESFWQVLGILRKLRNFGQGFVNFGQPIHLTQVLNEQVPEWREDIHPTIPQKPTWFPNFVNDISQQIMCNINSASALNSVTLTSMSLLAAPNHSLFRDDLESQLSLCVDLLREAAPFSNLTLPPTDNSAKLLAEAIAMDKFQVEENQGHNDIISLSDDNAVLLTYYRNNIIHLYILPSLVASCLLNQNKVTKADLNQQIARLLPLMSTEYFLQISDEQLQTHLTHVLNKLAQHKLVKLDGDNIYPVAHAKEPYLQLHLLSLYVQETLQRYAIVLATVEQGLGRIELERQALTHAKQLAQMHSIKGPEFVDKSILSQFVMQLREAGILVTDKDSNLMPGEDFIPLRDTIYELIDGDVLHTIKHPI
ncbi:glycerol-3-phosphate 1-O-acyltransferase PlsB [Catenovulum sp. SM1970]|uniref:glycerol-3-phosphate 1-O-acyltransferase PlsB n=1 Tax=Marinifaba aquimaris TaxID=2741323 RepID=UPI0015727148|nr:glycerol-3-phosphate 1-O-acyltransferase PlsB [Marinifaba aquimaris]NTS76530.1 glycerol-3-phosphate 1-O-acyltransferase PlsB [Marinifaba aquimaris]